jgi:anti-sigma factor RsiW
VSPCHEFDVLIAERASGELDAGDRSRLDVHLSGCVRCRAELKACEEVLSLARVYEPAESAVVPVAFPAQPDLRRPVLGQLRTRRRRSRFAIVGSLSMAAAAAFVMAVALHGGPGTHPVALTVADSSSASWEPDVEGALEASTLGDTDSQDEVALGDSEVAALEASDMP